MNEVRFGTSGRNIPRGPRLTLEFRTEAYNFTNTPHFGNPSANVNAANFMRVLSAEQDQRQFRFGLRLAW